MFANLTHTIQSRFFTAARRGIKNASVRPSPFLALALILALAGCGQSAAGLNVKRTGSLASIPVTGAPRSAEPAQPAALEVREYPLVEQSTDNPTHVEFQQYVPAAVAAQRDGWRFPGLEDAAAGTNHALQPFGFHLEPNHAPPFGGYTLYQHGAALQTDIAKFWPVSIKRDAAFSSLDFMLPFQTHTGQKLIASLDGINSWPAAGENPGLVNSSPAYYGDQIAYAQTGGGQVSVYAGPSLLYSADEPLPAQPAGDGPRSLYTWGSPDSPGHWALELDQRVLMDGQDLSASLAAERVYEFHLLDGQPLYFYDKDGLAHISYAGKELPYKYDQIIYHTSGDLQIFNPGVSGNVLWFYALRDGLWYYVEAGIF